MAPLAEHIQENPGYICDTCNTRFKTAYALRLHNLYDHSNSIPCPMCTRRGFTCLNHLEDHITRLHPVPKYRCELCIRTFPTRSRLLEHANNHENYRCDLCNINYESIAGLRSHKSRYHLIQLNCELCKKIFANESELSIHAFNHHETRYQCSICPDKYFPTPKAFDDHKKRNHRTKATYIIRKRNGSTSSQQQIHEDLQPRPGPSSSNLEDDVDLPYLLEDFEHTIGDMSADVNALSSANLPIFETEYSHRRSFTCIECQKTITVGDPISHTNDKFNDKDFTIIENHFICNYCQRDCYSFVELYHHTEVHCTDNFLHMYLLQTS